MKKILLILLAVCTTVVALSAQKQSRPGITATQYLSKFDKLVEIKNSKNVHSNSLSAYTIDQVHVFQQQGKSGRNMVLMVNKNGGGILYLGFSPTIPENPQIMEQYDKECLNSSTRGGNTEWNLYDNCVKHKLHNYMY